MPKISDMLFGPEPVFPPSGCRQCDGLRKATNGKVQWCLRHDPNITEEERKRYGVAFEQVVALGHKTSTKQ
jgi:hypothetical protein